METAFSQNAQRCQLVITRILDVEGRGMQKKHCGYSRARLDQNPCLAAGLACYFRVNLLKVESVKCANTEDRQH